MPNNWRNNDREFLMWLHQHLTDNLHEDECLGYMHRFRHIISAIPIDQYTPEIKDAAVNSLDDLRRWFANEEQASKQSYWL